jgi:hypothetical protein
MSTAEQLVRTIEKPQTAENERDSLISKLNLLGAASDDIEKFAYTFWKEYFKENMQSILADRIVLISHLLPDDIFKQCFEDTFVEYQQRKKHLGIDDIRKFWAP